MSLLRKSLTKDATEASSESDWIDVASNLEVEDGWSSVGGSSPVINYRLCWASNCSECDSDDEAVSAVPSLLITIPNI